MSKLLETFEIEKEQVENYGSKYLLANGYMGYRGTLEEYTKDQLVGCTLSGIYDQVGDLWREPVNAPNALYTYVKVDDQPLHALGELVTSHYQNLDDHYGIFTRKTLYSINHYAITIESERFLSMDESHLMGMKYTVLSDKDCQIELITGIDTDVWDINGPHLEDEVISCQRDMIISSHKTHELKHQVVVTEGITLAGNHQVVKQTREHGLRKITFQLKANEKLILNKYAAMYTSLDGEQDELEASLQLCERAMNIGYDRLLKNHCKRWDAIWSNCEINIKGDTEANEALKYSMYQLLSIAPYHHKSLSIPARGLSGQVYKGGIFWDTELYMLPLFVYTNPDVAKTIIDYRINTLNGALEKAKEYGYEGAYYPWEGQEKGQDACTLFNIVDVHTNRPLRTYFRDKQIHISADVVYGIELYTKVTGDRSILKDGAMDVIIECAKFYLSYMYYKVRKKRYELLDVTGPDEFHERVNNNAYTNKMVELVFKCLVKYSLYLQKEEGSYYEDLDKLYDLSTLMEEVQQSLSDLYIPQPNEHHIIEQFDDYLQLEDISIDDIKERMIHPNEYLGGGQGLATTTQIIKQADTVLMLNLFHEEYSKEVKEKNWLYYEPRTKHDSTLSACNYAMLAARLGRTEYAYKYFMKTATIDLSGKSKQYVGSLYIGGTHPAANGGAWMSLVFGFAGIRVKNNKLYVTPHLPKKWESIQFPLYMFNQRLDMTITQDRIHMIAANSNEESIVVNVGNTEHCIIPGEDIMIAY